MNNIGFDEALLQQLTTQHSPSQQMWLSGYLYAVAQQQQPTVNTAGQFPGITLTPPPVSTHTPLKITVLYGSQTGNSKKAANSVVAKLKEKGLEAASADLNDYPTKNLKDEKIVLLVVSTQGEGEPPTAAEEFYKWLNGPRAPKLNGVQFAVCGLGDKSYNLFCQTGKDFDARFEALGAERIYDRADCDVDYEDTVETWAEYCGNSVHASLYGGNSVHANHVASGTYGGNSVHANHVASGVNRVPAVQPAVQPAVLYDRKHPFNATILEKIQLNGRGSEKETWHLELSLEGSGIQYRPGDALGIHATNPTALVQEVLYAAMLNGDKKVTFEGHEAPLRELLKNDLELTVITRDVLEKYANWGNLPKLKAILTDPAALKNFLYGRNVADLIREFPIAFGETTLVNILRKMPPRLYSIASSLEAHPEEVHLTVAAVRYHYNGRPHHGVASTFLADRLEVGDTVPVFTEENEYFKLPANDDTDIIMVGPGTGVAPFRAFVEDRSERGASGRNWLFFGNPHFDTDFLYQTEWLNHLKRGTLDRLDVAFSRDQQEKIYVQHRLAERAKLIYERLENGAYFYVCGDKNRMAADVQNAVLQLIATESGKGAEFAGEYLKNLKKQRRYLEDVY